MTDPDDQSEASAAGFREQFRWSVVLRDLIVVPLWVLLVTFAFGSLRWPTWAYYIVVFGGIIVYSLSGDPWVRRSSRR